MAHSSYEIGSVSTYCKPNYFFLKVVFLKTWLPRIFYKYINAYFKKFTDNIHADLTAARGTRALPFFFCSHFEKLINVLFEVELIINIRLPKYYRNMFNTQSFAIWQPAIIIFYQTSTVATHLTVLSSTTDKINRISNHFWKDMNML